MITNVEIKDSTIYCTTKLFDPSDTEEGYRDDLLSLAKSLLACSKVNCSECILCKYKLNTEPMTCDDFLMYMASIELNKLISKEE